jgi:lipoprotein NlpI
MTRHCRFLGEFMTRANCGLLSIFTLAVVFLSLPAAADDCVTLKGEAQIAACTRDIISGKGKGRDLATRYYYRGNAYQQKGDTDNAIADYSQAISNDPKLSEPYNNRGKIYADKRDYDNAIADFSLAISTGQKNVLAYFNRGIAYCNKRDYARAIDDLSIAISMNPKQSEFYQSRGTCYLRNGDTDRAIAEYSQAISIDPKSALAYHDRGDAYRIKNDTDRAIAEFTLAISIDPKYARAYSDRGRANLYAGSGDKALADFSQANALDPKNAYTALWLDIVGQRNNLPSRLPQTSSQVDMAAWPAPIVRLFMGQITVGAVLAAADDPDATKKKGQVCEANFFTGELSLLKGAKEEATRLFRIAGSECPHDFSEWSAANAEIKALGAAP